MAGIETHEIAMVCCSSAVEGVWRQVALDRLISIPLLGRNMTRITSLVHSEYPQTRAQDKMRNTVARAWHGDPFLVRFPIARI